MDANKIIAKFRKEQAFKFGFLAGIQNCHDVFCDVINKQVAELNEKKIPFVIMDFDTLFAEYISGHHSKHMDTPNKIHTKSFFNFLQEKGIINVA